VEQQRRPIVSVRRSNDGGYLPVFRMKEQWKTRVSGPSSDGNRHKKLMRAIAMNAAFVDSRVSRERENFFGAFAPDVDLPEAVALPR